MMFQEIELPDGSIAEFPVEMSDAEILTVLQKEFPKKGMMESIGEGAMAAGETLLRGTADLPLGIAQTVAEQFPENKFAQGVRETVGRIAAETNRVAEQAPLGGVLRAVPQAFQVPVASAASMLGRAAVAGAMGAGASAVQPTTDTERGAVESAADRGIQGAIGGALGFGLSPAMEFGIGKLQNAPVIQRIFKQSVPEEKLSDAERLLTQAMGADDATNTAKVMAQSAKEGVAEPLFSATETPVLRAYANVISRSGDKTLQSKQALDKYIASATTKESQLLNELSNLASTADDAAFVFKGGIESIKTAAKTARSQAAAPLYKNAYNELLPDEAIIQLTQKQTVLDALKTASKEIPDEVAKYPNGSVGQFDLAARFLKGQARAEVNPTIKAAKNEVAEMLDDVLLKNSKELQKARSVYAEGSADINQLLGLDKKTLAARVLDAQDPLTATQRLFKGNPAEIAQTREMFKKYGMEDAFNAGTKAHIVKKLNDIKVGANLGKAFANQTERNQLVAALGKEKAAGFIKMLALNERLMRSKGALGGSPTQSLVQASAELQEAGQRKVGGLISKGLEAYGAMTSPRETAFALSKNWQNPQFTTEIANILFDPKIGASFTQKLIKAKDQQAANAVIKEINDMAIQRMAQKAALTGSITTTQGE